MNSRRKAEEASLRDPATAEAKAMASTVKGDVSCIGEARREPPKTPPKAKRGVAYYQTAAVSAAPQ